MCKAAPLHCGAPFSLSLIKQLCQEILGTPSEHCKSNLVGGPTEAVRDAVLHFWSPKPEGLRRSGKRHSVSRQNVYGNSVQKMYKALRRRRVFNVVNKEVIIVQGFARDTARAELEAVALRMPVFLEHLKLCNIWAPYFRGSEIRTEWATAEQAQEFAQRFCSQRVAVTMRGKEHVLSGAHPRKRRRSGSATGPSSQPSRCSRPACGRDRKRRQNVGTGLSAGQPQRSGLQGNIALHVAYYSFYVQAAELIRTEIESRLRLASRPVRADRFIGMC